MNVMILGAGGFIGTNLALELSKDKNDQLTLVDRNQAKLDRLVELCGSRTEILQSDIVSADNMDAVLAGQDLVYHLVSTTVPAISNRKIPEEIRDNVGMMAKLLESCVKCKVGRVVFLSSGGTVYGSGNHCPFKEEMETLPMNSYGVQKVMNEKLLYLYHYIHGLDYKIVRLANPFGPYQNPNGVQGAVAVFTYKTLWDEKILVYGDGSVVRDYIYIDDAIRAIVNIARSKCEEHVFNVGSGKGISISQLLEVIEHTLGRKAKIEYMPGRRADVRENYLDIARYERIFGKLIKVSLEEGIQRMADFMREEKVWNV